MDVWGVVMRNVDAKPEPPCVEILEVEESKERARRMALSIEEGISDPFVGMFLCGCSDK